ncbi:MAG: SCO family protein [Gammaproteobacteria bacterium]|nr:SCO family protein [Gammaproteobacteria bacterium]
MCKALTIIVFIAALLSAQDSGATESGRYDADQALKFSQQAVGRVIGDYELLDRQGRVIRLRSDHAGRPFVVSMIFTSCHHVCPTTTKHLAKAVAAARDALGADSFDVVTIGFDVANDTPEAMAAFARRQGIDDDHWRFLNASPENIDKISADLGFIFFPTPRGFDHINQSSVIDRDGSVYSQVYGVSFELPWLVEPLKDLVFNRPSSAGHLFAGLIDKVKLFCTVYDPTTGRYRFDNSLFMQVFVGATTVLAIIYFLFREILAARRAKRRE